MKVQNLTRNRSLGDLIEVAGSSSKRRTGLLNRENLPEGGGLWIVPSNAIHTFFMKFAIDVIYVDRKHRVTKVVQTLGPWAVSGCLRGHSILELPAGLAQKTDTREGDQLSFGD